jgi:D-threo-aldose 1-dehydrogenase
VRVAERARIGPSSVEVTRFGLGTAPLRDLFTRVDPDEADAVVTTALDAGATLVDTAPSCGLGLSEHRVGSAVRSRPRESVVLATKVGRVLRPARSGRHHSREPFLGGRSPLMPYTLLDQDALDAELPLCLERA